MGIELVSSNKHFGGTLNKYKHQSLATQCVMTFNVFLPKEAAEKKVPVLYCLGGLTCTEDNFTTKSGFGLRASQYGMALVFPDTSPRDVAVSEAGANSGIGYSAGFYLNATQHPWDKNWKMYDYITQELPQALAENLSVDISRSSITGHSMGGHGALTIFLKNQDKYKTVSAFAPITHPTKSSWGTFALPQYLGEDPQAWDDHDTIKLLQRYKEQNEFRSDVKVLIDQGTTDPFLDRLHTSELIKVVDQLGLKDQFEIRYQDGYDHSYYFISTFINDHIDHHAKALGLTLPCDGGKTFHKIAEYTRTCPELHYEWPVRIPDNVPSCDKVGQCLFVWSWTAVKVPQFYMNCADVIIQGSSNKDGVLSSEGIQIVNADGFEMGVTAEGDDADMMGKGPDPDEVKLNLGELLREILPSLPVVRHPGTRLPVVRPR